jgi:hypothetical protein
MWQMSTDTKNPIPPGSRTNTICIFLLGCGSLKKSTRSRSKEEVSLAETDFLLLVYLKHGNRLQPTLLLMPLVLKISRITKVRIKWETIAAQKATSVESHAAQSHN